MPSLMHAPPSRLLASHDPPASFSSSSQGPSVWPLLVHKLIHSRQNTAQYDAYLNTISIYIRLLERFHKPFQMKPDLIVVMMGLP